MPPGTPYNAFILPYKIRVDDFADASNLDHTPALHLLTHTHTDHINGLSAKSFGSTIICSHDAKEMLLRHEVYAERALHEQELRSEKLRTFSHLKVDPFVMPDGGMNHTGSRDLLRPLPLDTPTVIQLDNSESVRITLFDANHCPGAVMFLVEGNKGAILHTGDFRAEHCFLDRISRNPYLQRYLESPPINLERSVHTGSAARMCLDAIYLDTASLLSKLDAPTKKQATSGLIELMAMLPSTTLFFVNAWTWGYEDILKAISIAFRSRIHVDRYKYSIYSHVSDPLLRALVTRDPRSTRFHACERFCRCEYVAVENGTSTDKDGKYSFMNKDGRIVVYINPVTMSEEKWKSYLIGVRDKICRGELVTNLLVPLLRHSPLPELQAFVSLFRPRKVVPNTLIPGLRGLDWAAMSGMFGHCLASPFIANASGCLEVNITSEELEFDQEDVTLKNLEGAGAIEVAERWAESRKTVRTLEILREYLTGQERALVDIVIKRKAGTASIPNILNPQIQAHDGVRYLRRYGTDEDTDSSEAEEARGRTAHQLFADQSGVEGVHIWPSSPQSSDDLSTDGRLLPASPKQNLQNIPSTPSSSPVRTTSNPRDNCKNQQSNPLHVLPQAELPTSKLGSPMQLSPWSYPALDASRQLGGPFVDVNNVLGKRVLSHTPPQPSTPAKNWIATSNRQKRRRVDTENPAVENQSPISDRSVGSSSGDSDAQVADRVAPLLPPHALTFNYWRTQSPKKILTPLSGHIQATSLGIDSATITERLHIGDKLSRARPDLVAPSYAPKRIRQLSWSAKSKAEHRDDRSISPVTMGVRAAAPDHSIVSTDAFEDDTIDWDRSRVLADTVLAQLGRGEPVALPALMCLNSQLSDGS